MKSVVLLACSLRCAVSSVLPRTSQDCSSFASSVDLSEYNGSVLNATYHSTNSVNITNVFNDIPFCEVYGTIAYGSNDSLVFALWLPDASSYEQRFMAVGNGGMAGIIDTLNMITQLNAGLGFAVAGGDAGHLASVNNNGGGAPGMYLPYLHDRHQVEAWIHDAISLFTPAAKVLAETYYGTAARRSYYDGCSTGGAQGYALAQYHPELFDGIYAGSPGNWYSHLALSFLWNAQHTNVSWKAFVRAL
jgi:feruloyl esterase